MLSYVGKEIPKRILVVDDDDVFRKRLAQALMERGFEVYEASSLAEVKKIVEEVTLHCALIDLCMPGGSGLELIGPLKESFPEISIVVLTGYGSIVTAVEAMRLGASNYISKPADVDMILHAFEYPSDVQGRDELLPQSVPELKTVEWEHIQRVLYECNGNVSKASQLLGVHRRSLQRKLARMHGAKD